MNQNDRIIEAASSEHGCAVEASERRRMPLIARIVIAAVAVVVVATWVF